MNFFKLFPAVFCLLVFVFSACGGDPWTQRGNPVDTDEVTITKVTAFGTQKDGTPYKGQVGAVVMSHKVHEEAGLSCEDCHHKKGNDARVKHCAKCHNGEAGYKTMHGLCVDCHIAKGKGPQKCMGCH